jgi:conjugative transfer signal peptidase TraF
MKRFIPLISAVSILATIILVTLFFHRKLVVYNYTDSLPNGFYLLIPGAVNKGDLIAFEPPPIAAELIRTRKYLRSGGVLLKQIVGVKGDSVYTKNGEFFVNGESYGGFVNTDKEGRFLPRFSFFGRLPEDKVVVAIKGKDNSYDSRYFGPVPKRNILGRLRLILRTDQ